MASLSQHRMDLTFSPSVQSRLQHDRPSRGTDRISQRVSHPQGINLQCINMVACGNAHRNSWALVSDAGRLQHMAALRGNIGRNSSATKAGHCNRQPSLRIMASLKKTGSVEKKEREGARRISARPASTAGRASRANSAEAAFFRFSQELGKYVVVMFGTGIILATGSQLTGDNAHFQSVLWTSWCAGIVVGSMIGAGQVLDSHSQARAGPRNVIVTGSTRGLGKALAREFLRCGDNVVVASRSEETVAATVEELRRLVRRRGQVVVGLACDVANSDDVRALAALAVKELGRVDLWVNNAGTNTGAKLLVEFEDAELERIVSTNLTGSLVCTREAVRLMRTQPRGGHVFNMDGAGSGGGATPRYAAYGATKCGLRQLQLSLLSETKGTRVGVHTASPGMVLTDLLLSGATLQNKQMFNIVCEQPETVARALVPKMRRVRGTGKAFNYLTPLRVVFALATAWIRRGRWFDAEGRAVYAAEAERLTAWAKGQEKSPITAAMELVPGSAWVSLFSSSAICAYIMLSHGFTNIR